MSPALILAALLVATCLPLARTAQAKHENSPSDCGDGGCDAPKPSPTTTLD